MNSICSGDGIGYSETEGGLTMTCGTWSLWCTDWRVRVF